MDERQQHNAGAAAMVTLFLVGLGGLGYIGWDFLAHKDITQPWVLVVVLVAWGIFYLAHKLIGGEAPESLFGVELPTSDSAADRRTRRRSYLLDAVALAAGMTAMSVLALVFGYPNDLSWPWGLSTPVAIAGSAVAGFAIMVVVFYALDHLLGEAASRGFERRMAKLEARA